LSAFSYGIRVLAKGTGSETVTTDANSSVTSAGTGINVANIASTIGSGAGSSITVTTHGTIHSGTTNNNDGSVAGGIYAGYRGVGAPTTPAPDLNVFGAVTVNNNANITADAGFGIDAYNWGVGDVTVNEGANTTINAAQIGIGAFVLGTGAGNANIGLGDNVKITTTSSYGIQAYTAGPGNVSVSTTDTDTIHSGGSGIVATNGDAPVSATALGSITVNAHGTIDAGGYVNANGPTTIAGVLAGYNGANGLATPNVNGAVTVNNYANISMIANTVREFGIDAFDYGNGDVTVNDEAGTTISVASGISGAAAIGAFQNGGGTGNVLVNLLGNAKVTNTVGLGINANNTGTGTLTINTSQSSQVTGGTVGINANASGGKLTIANDGTVSGATGMFAGTTGSNDIAINNAGSITGTGTGSGNAGIKVGQAGANVTGSTTITNSGTVAGTGSHAAISVAENAIGTAVITNTGTIGSATNTNAIFETGGHLVINNDSVLDQSSHVVGGGAIDGAINAATTTFTNQASANWNAVGTSNFGASSTIDNAGTVNLASASISGASGLTITNDASGVIDGVSGTNLISGATINNAGIIESTGGTLTIDPAPLTNTGTLEAVTGGTLKLTNIAVTNTVTDGQGMHHDGTVSTDGASFLDLDGSSITGGTVVIAGTLVSTGVSAIDGATINYSGTFDVTAGTLTIDATSTLNNTGTGLFKADGGNLVIDTALSGHIEISGSSTVELGAAESAYSGVTVTFDPGATGNLVLDHAAAGTSSPTVAGLDDNSLDFHNIVYGSHVSAVYSGTTAGGTLHIYQGNVDVADIKLTGDYLGAHWVLGDDGSSAHGTTIAEAPGAITAGLDANGNAVEGAPITASITDGGQSVTVPQTGNEFHWQIFDAVQNKWIDGTGTGVNSATYTPGEGDDGHALRVAVSYTDALGNPETSTVSAGTVNQVSETSAITASASGINEDGTSTLTLGNFAGLFEDGDDVVTVTVSLDHGAKLHGTGVTDNGDGTFTLTAHSTADLNGLTITPASEYEGPVAVGVTAVAQDGAAATATSTASTTLTVNPVSESSAITASASGINEDGISTLTLGNFAGLFEDGDDVVTVTVSLDHGAKLHGTGVIDHGDGTFTLTAHSVADLNGLTITPAAEYEGAVAIGVKAVAQDGAAATATSTASTTLTVNGRADTPTVSATTSVTATQGTATQGPDTVHLSATSTEEPAVGGNVSAVAAEATESITVNAGSGASLDTWTGAGDGSSWADAANWSNGVPGANNAVEINPDSAVTITISSDDTIFSLSSNANVTLVVDAETTLTVAGPVTSTILGPINDFGTIHVDGGGTLIYDSATVTGGGAIIVDTSVQAATLTLDDGASITGGTLSIGSAGTVDIEVGPNGPGSPDATLDGVTVTNSGTIEVDLNASSAILALDDGTTINGGAMSIGSSGALDVEVGQTPGGSNGYDATLDGVKVTNSGTIEVDLNASGAVLALVDGTTITGGALDIESSGEVYVQNGNGSIGATLDGVAVTNNGNGIEIGGPVSSGSTLVLDDGTVITGGKLTFDHAADVLDVEVGPGSVNGPGSADATLSGVTVSGGATVKLGNGSTLTLQGSTVSDGTIAFTGTGDTLTVDASSDISNATINGFALGDSIDLSGIVANGYTFDGTNLVLTENGHSVGSLTMTGLAADTRFSVVDDGSGQGILITENPVVKITVFASDGLDFQHDPNPITEMGSGTIQPGDATTYTVANNGSLPHFVFDGSGFTYDLNGNVTGGTITAIHEFAADGSPIADFIGQFDAAQWMTDVKLAANNHDFSGINALVANYNFEFQGGAGPDGFGGAGYSENLSGGGGNDVLDPGTANGGKHLLTGGSGADTFVYKKGYGAVTITDFDQGNGGTYNPTEGDQIKLNGLSEPVSLTYDGSNTIADYGNGDILTLLNVNLAQVGSVSGVVKAPASPGPITGNFNTTLNPPISVSQFIQVSAASIFVTSGPGVNIGAGAYNVVLDIDAASTIQTTAAGASGIVFNASGGNIDLVNDASVTTSTNAAPGAVGINIGEQGAGNITLVNTGNITAGSAGIAANNNSSSVPLSAKSFIFVSNFGTINAGANPQSTMFNIPANGIWAGYGNGSATTTWGTVVVDDSADVTATSSLQGGASGIVAFNNSNGNVTVNVGPNPDGPDTTITGYKYGIQATANNKGTVNGNSVNGAGSASGDVTINLSQHVTVNATGSANGTYGIFAENFNNVEGNITVNMAAGDVITSKGAGINVYDGATSLASGTILVNAEGTINSGSFLTGTGGQPAGILAGYLGTSNGIPPSGGNFPVAGLNGNVIINSAADITAAVGDEIRGYTYGATGDITVNATAGTIVAQALTNTTNGNGDGISAQDNGGGTIHVTTAADVSITAGGSGIAANNGDNGNGNTGAVTGEISVVAYGTIESGTNAAILSGNNTSPTAGILAGYNGNSGQVEGNVHGNVMIDDHASITADHGDGIRGYNFGNGDVTITVESDSIVHGARYGVSAFTFDGGAISLTNYGSITGNTDAIDVNYNGSIPANGTATVDNRGQVHGNIAAYNTTFTNEAGGDWSMNGTSIFSGNSTLTNAGTIEGNGGTVEVAQSASLSLSGVISGAVTLKIDAGATLDLASGVASGQTVTFGASTGVLKLDDPADFGGTIAGITGNGQVMDMHGFEVGTTATTGVNSYDIASDTTKLTVFDPSQGLTETFKLKGDLSTHTFMVTDDGNGGVNIVDPPASNSDPLGPVMMHDPGPGTDQVAIGHEGTSELAADAVAAVTFADAAGKLILDDASNSTISVAGFTGNGTLAGSDQIDLKGIDYTSQQFAENFDSTKGLLTIADGNKAATLQFSGTYQAANFNFVSDGHGGTIVFDPPVANNPADDQHTNSADGDCFAFNLPGVQPFIQHAFEELQDTLAPLKDLLHLAGAPELPCPPGQNGVGLQQTGAVTGTWTDTLKLLVPHTDLHV
jgi:hypothetical protein